ncbi:MAG: hypothetical protein HOP28_15945 [Gemmatimonadales bacterium]|nr:hypothetical protein [Gemmatimonadales bacterium]
MNGFWLLLAAVVLAGLVAGFTLPRQNPPAQVKILLSADTSGFAASLRHAQATLESFMAAERLGAAMEGMVGHHLWRRSIRPVRPLGYSRQGTL